MFLEAGDELEGIAPEDRVPQLRRPPRWSGDEIPGTPGIGGGTFTATILVPITGGLRSRC